MRCHCFLRDILLGCYKPITFDPDSSYCQPSMFSSVLSHLNKNLKLWMLEPWACHRSRTDCVIALGSWADCVIALRSRTDGVIALRTVLQLRVTAQFYLENSRKIHPQGARACRPKDAKRREGVGSPGPLALPFIICFSSPLGLPYVNWADRSALFYLRSSLRSLNLPLFYFCRLFPSLSFSHHHFGLLFPILTT